MDCFFASVALRDRPHLCDKPVAIAHSRAANGSAEISTCNYVARSYNIRSGMVSVCVRVCVRVCVCV